MRIARGAARWPATLLVLVALVACGGGWAENDQQAFMESCLAEGAPIIPPQRISSDEDDVEHCECSLERAQEQWDGFKDIDDENDFGKMFDIFQECRSSN